MTTESNERRKMIRAMSDAAHDAVEARQAARAAAPQAQPAKAASIHVCPTCNLAGQAIADERDAWRVEALRLRARSPEPAPAQRWHAPGIGEVHNEDHSRRIFCERASEDSGCGYVIDDALAKKVCSVLNAPEPAPISDARSRLLDCLPKVGENHRFATVDVDDLRAVLEETAPAPISAERIAALCKALDAHDANVEHACADRSWDESAQAVISAADTLLAEKGHPHG